MLRNNKINLHPKENLYKHKRLNKGLNYRKVKLNKMSIFKMKIYFKHKLNLMKIEKLNQEIKINLRDINRFQMV